MSDPKSFRAQLSKKDLHKKGQVQGQGQGNRDSDNFAIGSGGKRRGLGFQDVQKNESKIMRKTITKKHLVNQNPKKKGDRREKGKNRDEEEEEVKEEISDHEEDSRYNMFKKKSDKK